MIWQADYDLTAKLMYGSAFRAPSFQEMYILNNPAQIGNPQLKPETMENLELGFDYRPADGLRLGLNFSVIGGRTSFASCRIAMPLPPPPKTGAHNRVTAANSKRNGRRPIV